MFGIKVQITKCIDDESFPGFVECQFTDVYKITKVFHEKNPIVTLEVLDRKSHYPRDGVIGCEIIERKRLEERQVVKVNTSLPWHIESITGETVFELFEEQIIEFQHP